MTAFRESVKRREQEAQTVAEMPHVARRSPKIVENSQAPKAPKSVAGEHTPQSRRNIYVRHGKEQT